MNPPISAVASNDSKELNYEEMDEEHRQLLTVIILTAVPICLLALAQAAGWEEVVAERVEVPTMNVVGVLPGKDPTEYVVVGAHMDHLGDGLVSGSLAGAEGAGQIHNGADDNASGTSVVMELAAAVTAELHANPDKYQYGFVFAAWSGEEMGIIGSSFFANNPPVPLGSFIVAGRPQQRDCRTCIAQDVIVYITFRACSTFAATTYYYNAATAPNDFEL